MNKPSALEFKIASEPSEREQIHRLNHQTFAEEIQQHHENPDRKLVDKFDPENTYAICKRGGEIMGMVCMRGTRPFSLDQKLPQLDSYLPPGRSLCEVRLLAVEKTRRGGLILRGLLDTIVAYGKAKGYTLALISGIVDQQKLYEHMGFVPFGPQVGTNGVRFQPMYLTLEAWEERSQTFLKTVSRERPMVNLLPGPVGIRASVREAFGQPPLSHRCEKFLADFQQVKQLACAVLHARHVEILTGSGTLANETIGAQLSLTHQPGLVLSNGEFGERLVDQATRWRLPFQILRKKWGAPFSRESVEAMLAKNKKIKWLWAVHCETSTGVLNDLSLLKEICAQHKVNLCLDGIGSIGTLPVDLSGVALATAVSGKALGAYPGLALVFHRQTLRPQPKKLPRYLDLGLYAAKEGVPFTLSSNLLYALLAALKRLRDQPPFAEIAALSDWLRPQLRACGFKIVAADEHASPAVITLALPQAQSSQALGDRLAACGYLLSYKSDYLLKRNWIQICLMGECSQESLTRMLAVLQESALPQS